MNMVAQTWSHPHKTIGRQKSEAQVPSSCGIQEDQQNSLNGFKVSRRLTLFSSLSLFFPFFLSPSVMKSPEIDQKEEYKVNPQN